MLYGVEEMAGEEVMYRDREDKIKNLIGKTLVKIIDDTESVIFQLLDEKDVTFTAYGDCCSDSWIESVESPTEPEVIVSFEEINIPPSFEEKDTLKRTENEMDSLAFYFYKVTTEKGSYLIEMRNNSNGYYGGWLE